MPAMGASTTGVAEVYGPICNGRVMAGALTSDHFSTPR